MMQIAVSLDGMSLSSTRSKSCTAACRIREAAAAMCGHSNYYYTHGAPCYPAPCKYLD
jgi:hypothetical protein